MSARSRCMARVFTFYGEISYICARACVRCSMAGTPRPPPLESLRWALCDGLIYTLGICQININRCVSCNIVQCSHSENLFLMPEMTHSLYLSIYISLSISIYLYLSLSITIDLYLTLSLASPTSRLLVFLELSQLFAQFIG